MSILTLEEFEAALDRDGADLGKWPAQQQVAAMALMAQSAEARQLFESARQVEELLASASGIKAPRGLADRIANFVLRKPPNKPDKS
ncbi:hypothetical protein [Devosia sp.]|uniref:hypothetical protein n=1 Tax=Devosia sp. TaxID=1871048 RepID=UPI003BAB58C0